MSFVAGQSSVFVKAPTRANGFKRRRYSEAEKRKKSVFLPRKHRTRALPTNAVGECQKRMKRSEGRLPYGSRSPRWCQKLLITRPPFTFEAPKTTSISAPKKVSFGELKPRIPGDFYSGCYLRFQMTRLEFRLSGLLNEYDPGID